ncbi:MAG: hypothetical protein L6427_07065 [Actinomycetia bacterium]|nr:hypothetical protein [Actinomycetes bacterium]
MKHKNCEERLNKALEILDERFEDEHKYYYLSTLPAVVGLGVWAYWHFVVIRSEPVNEAILLFHSDFVWYLQVVIPAALIIQLVYGLIRVNRFMDEVWKGIPHGVYSSGGDDSCLIGLLYLVVIVGTAGLVLVVYFGYKLKHLRENVVNECGTWDENYEDWKYHFGKEYYGDDWNDDEGKYW